jgi:hypothetical protein
MMISSGHPIYHLQSRLLAARPNLTLEFSRYIHLGHGKTLSRNTFRVAANEITEQWLIDNLSALDPSQELALHSKVTDSNATYHIPMVDFINTLSVAEVEPVIAPINKILSTDVWLCSSGQSLHGYYFALIEERKWIDYLANLLLCNRNEKNEKEIVDQRWIAHSLEHRFSALRWSHNTETYLSMPNSHEIGSVHY